MKQFFKIMFASMLGFILTLIVVFFIFVGIIASLVSLGKKETVAVDKNSVLLIKFEQPITERSTNNPFEKIDFRSMKSKEVTGLDDILKNIKKAQTDNNIKGIYLDLSIVPARISTLQEIRNALLEFKKTKKFIISYSEMYMQGTYYLASVSDKIYINPEGYFLFKGLAANYMFLKGTLGKLDLDMQVIRHGKFKSAVEQFTNDKMSDANKLQTMAYIKSVWNNMLSDISLSRNISLNELNRIADEFKIETPKDAVKYRLVDGLAYKDEVLAELASLVKVKDINKIKYITLGKYSKAPESKSVISGKKDRIALVYASGEIQSGEGDDNTIGSEKISKAIRQARMDNKVKAIVLRVNSPGGSALASDVIWREVVLAKLVKPVVVSMGDLAASGGYYISCGASKIFAEPNTLTGSIGVFGIIPNLKGLLNKKLGITLDGVKTDEYADIGDITRPITTGEKAIFEREIDNIYHTFLKHVSEGRKLSVSNVDSIAQGRIWCANDAKRIGLIDNIGGINDAISAAADLAKIKEYKVTYLPEQKDVIKQLLESLTGEDVKTNYIKKELGENYIYFESLKNAAQMKGIQARLPFDFILN
jgi:protease IV